MNVGGNYYRFNKSKTPREADSMAMFMDWARVGEDIWEAIHKEGRSLKKVK